MKISQTEYQRRRDNFFAAMDDNSIAIIAAAKHHERNFDNEVKFRQSSDFYYLTGFPEPKAYAAFSKKSGKCRFILFNQVRNALMETWTGPIVGQEGAERDYGVDSAYPETEFLNKLPDLLSDHHSVYCEIGYDNETEMHISKAIGNMQAAVRRGKLAPTRLNNAHQLLHELRLRKSAEEIDIMAKVGDISAKAHVRCMQATKPEKYEYQIEAEFIYHTMSAGCQEQAYNGIFAGGKNACVLHYNANNSKLKDGDLLLVDAGAELDNYASDITRTYPVNGRFSPEQRDLYEVVLSAQLAVIDAVKPGTCRGELEDISRRKLSEGLIELGILNAPLEQVLEEKLYSPFYMHLIGHWIGIDTHDRGSYKTEEGHWRKLEPGFALTVEPGLYISPNNDAVDKRWWGIGIRIEDDIIVTEKGHRVLTSAAPKTVTEIETLMAEAR